MTTGGISDQIEDAPSISIEVGGVAVSLLVGKELTDAYAYYAALDPEVEAAVKA